MKGKKHEFVQGTNQLSEAGIESFREEIKEVSKEADKLLESIEQKKLNEERMSFMKLLAIGTLEIEEGKVVSENDFLGEMDDKDATSLGTIGR